MALENIKLKNELYHNRGRSQNSSLNNSTVSPSRGESERKTTNTKKTHNNTIQAEFNPEDYLAMLLTQASTIEDLLNENPNN